MMTQSVTTQTAGLAGAVSGCVTGKSNQKGKSFECFIRQSCKTDQNPGSNGNAVNAKAAVKDGKSTKACLANQPKTQVDKSKGNVEDKDDTKTNTNTNTKDVDTKNSADQLAINTQDADTGNVSKSVNDELTQKCVDMVKKIKKTIMEMLGLSEDALNQLMQQLGMTMADFANADALKQLVLANSNQEDITSILTDETLSDTLQQLLQNVDQIKTEADLPLTNEQVKDLLAKAQIAGAGIPVQKQSVMKEGDLETGKQVSDDRMTFLVEKKPADNSVNTQNSKDTQNSQQSEEGKLGLSSVNSQNVKAAAKENENSKQPDQFQNFVDRLAQVTLSKQTDSEGNQTQMMQIRDVANQIIEKIRVIMKPGQTSMELQLNPESLGKVNLTIHSKNGLMTAQFLVQNEVSRQAIESQLTSLKEALNQQGVKVEAIEVAVAGYAFDQSSSQDSKHEENANRSSSRRKISLEEATVMDEISQEDSSAEDNRVLRGSQVDYTA
jgi:flagellar hook-length control protein FliK